MAFNREAAVAAAEKLVARGKIDGAIKEYRKVVADNPTDATALNRLGDLYVRLNKNEEAVKLFTQIAENYTEDGFFVKAIAIFKKIIKLDPTRLPVYERLAELYHKQGLVSEARTQYQVLVDYYLKHGKVESGESVLRKMTALDSGDPSPHVKLAEIYRERGESEKELLELRALAEMMIRHKRVDEAMQVYTKAIAAAPQDLGFITDAVLGLKDEGYPAAAAKLLTLAVEKNPQAEKIARIAGLGKDRRTEGTAPGVGARGGGEGARPIKVSDVVAPLPPELRSPAAPSAASLRSAPPRPEALRFEPPADEEVAHLPRPAPELTPPADAGLSGRARRELLESTWGATPIPAVPAPPASSPPPGSPAETGAVEEEIEIEIEGLEDLSPSASTHPMPAPPEPEAPPIEWSFEPEPELLLPPIPPPPVAPPPPPEPRATAPRPEVAESPPAVGRRPADLLAEAEVFRKYGLREKAHDRVREILRENARHPGALALGTLLLLDDGKPERACARAQELERLVGGVPGAEAAWEALRPKLEKAGFAFSGAKLTAPPKPTKAEKDAVAALLDELSGLARPSRSAPKRAATAPSEDLAALVDGLRPTARPAPGAVPPPVVSPPPAPPADLGAAPPPSPPAPDLSEIEDAAIEDRLSWLDDAAARATPETATSRASAAAEQLFDEEEGFFDLAAELEEELTKEEIETGRELLPREEPSLEEIVEGFKKGVAESLSPEDYDTHFNLGIAYREMGLLDEAIGEFQLAAKHPTYLLDCCSLLGACFLDKGLPELAIKWFQRGLAIPDLTEEANLGLLYDLGNLYLATGDEDSARRTFVELYGINSNYRDVVAKLEELGSR
jgi:pilus assembly protein FimV